MQIPENVQIGITFSGIIVGAVVVSYWSSGKNVDLEPSSPSDKGKHISPGEQILTHKHLNIPVYLLLFYLSFYHSHSPHSSFAG